MASAHSPHSFWHHLWVKRGLGLALIVFVFWVGWRVATKTGSDVPYPSDYDYGVTSYDVQESESGSRAYEESYDEYDDSLSAVPTYDSATDTLQTEARIIKTASYSLQVKDTPEAVDSLISIASAYGGYVQSSETWVEYDESISGYVTLRVSVEFFEQALEDIKALATVVESESISGQDVTEEYVDLEARLTSTRAEEARYLDILDQADTVEELLMVSDYLSAVREEIEVFEGRLKYLDDRTDYSTISIWLYEETSIILPTSDWQPSVVVKQAFNRLVVVLQGVVDLLIWFGVVGVPLLLGLWVLYWVGRAVVRRRHKK